MVHRDATTLSTNTTTDNGIMAQQNTGNDNAHTDTRDEDDTPETMQRNATTKTNLQAQWKSRNNALQEKTQQPGTKDTNKETEYTKNKGKQTSRN